MKKGFGLIEVLISSAIIASVLGSLVYIGRLALTNVTNNEERFQALGLADEGIEIVRQIRDTNWIDSGQNTSWNSFVLQSNGLFSTIDLNKNETFIIKNEKTAGGQSRYGLIPGNGERIKVAEGNFVRSVNIEPVGDLISSNITGKNRENFNEAKNKSSIKVTCSVDWGDGNNVKVSEIMTNWRPNY